MRASHLSGIVSGSAALLLMAGCSLNASNSTSPGRSTATANGSSLQTSQVAVTSETGNVIQDAVVRTSAAVSPKVVVINSASGLGSGEILDSRGYIVTNYHVLSGGGQSLQPPFTVGFSNGKTYRATVAGTDANDDLAVLKINAGKLQPIALGDSSKIQVGQFVLAVGNPLGYASTVTFGIISTLGRGLAENGPAAFLPDLIQTSAPINPGNSGGALVDLSGRLIGIPTLAAQDPEQGSAAQGIGFAIPVNRVRFIADQLIKSGKVTNSGRAYLGIVPIEITPQAQSQYGLPVDHGVLVYQASSGGPAAKAGLHQGDIILGINNTTVTNNADLLDALSRFQPGQKVTLKVLQSGNKTRNVTVTLGTLPVSSAH